MRSSPRPRRLFALLAVAAGGYFLVGGILSGGPDLVGGILFGGVFLLAAGVLVWRQPK